ncbi:MAG: hypothetical protein CSA76_03505 [Spirochaetales bacterium]|nr:MAG: hypothetical protein CSA76_03505 [Spirochaetales bacterium]
MFHKPRRYEIDIVGISLEGSSGSPAVIFQSREYPDMFCLDIDVFAAEMIVREFSGESSFSTLGWLEEFLSRRPPRFGLVEKTGEDGIRVGFSSPGSRHKRYLRLGEALALSRRLSIPLYAEEPLFFKSFSEKAWLSNSNTFIEDFLYFSPLHYPSVIY